MEPKKEFIADLANNLVATNKTLTGDSLIDALNNAGHLTSRGGAYESGRGVYKLIHATYYSLVYENRQPEADNVANAFTNASGNPAWEK